MMRHVLIMTCSLALVACSAEEENIRAWMADQERGMVGRVAPLPEVKPFPVVSYDADAFIEPFASSRIVPETRVATGGPDLTRQREPLEAYPLESIALVGVLMQDDVVQGLVRVDRSIHQVNRGNYLGLDHGVVTDISETEITLKELVEDINGDWVERTSTLLLQER